jgi:hypothetical protein
LHRTFVLTHFWKKHVFCEVCVSYFCTAVSFDRQGTEPSFLLSLFHLCLNYNLQFSKNHSDPILQKLFEVYKQLKSVPSTGFSRTGKYAIQKDFCNCFGLMMCSSHWGAARQQANQVCIWHGYSTHFCWLHRAFVLTHFRKKHVFCEVCVSYFCVCCIFW